MATTSRTLPNPHRFRLRRAGVLNVWQYDEQVFDVEGGRLLLRGTNGAGKSKTLEMLLPFALDGDKARMTASGRHHTSLLWLMLDGYDDSASRTGYVWVEFERTRQDGTQEHLTCGVGLRASSSARQANAWHFVTSRRVGIDLDLEDDGGPLTRPRLQAELDDSGTVFESAPRYKEHVGRELFGLDPVRYDELLRLLYWLRQPQVGEDIDPARLAGQLVQALPQVDDTTVRAAGDTFDELEAFGEQIDRKDRAATAVEVFADLYARYARGRVAELATDLVDAHSEQRRRAGEVRRVWGELEAATTALEETGIERERTRAETRSTTGRLDELRSGPEARSERRLLELVQLVEERQRVAARAAEVAATAGERAERGRAGCAALATGLSAKLATERDRWSETSVLMTRSGWARGVVVGGPDTVTNRESAQSALRAMESVGGAVDAERPTLGALRAAVEVVDEARREHEAARAEAGRANERAAESDRSLDAAVEREDEVRGESEALVARLSSELGAWAARAPGFQVSVPEPTADELPGLPGLARRAAAPTRSEWTGRLAARAAELEALAAERDELDARRTVVASETDPRPPTPQWARDSRDGVAGAPFWRLVDFVPGTAPGVRAGVEAALEASGLLDAWVRPDGAVLDPGRHDVVLAAGPESSGPETSGHGASGPTVATVLTADEPPPGSGVSRDVVMALLARIGWDAVGETAIAADGRWWLGGLQGRATKATAQYVGAGAREAERARRLAEIDDRLTVLAAESARAEEQRGAAAAAVQEVDDWVDSVPAGGRLIEAWAKLDVLEGATHEARERVIADQRLAEQARTRAVGAGEVLRRLAGTHDLPPDADGLATRRAALADLEQALAERVRAAAGLVGELRRWLDDDEQASADEVEHTQRRDQLDSAQAEHDEAAARLEETERTVGADVAELRRRVVALEDALRGLRSAADELDRRHDERVGAVGALTSRHEAAVERVEEARAPLVDAVRAFASGAQVPGVLDAVLGSAPGADLDLDPDADAARRRALTMVAADVDGPRPTLPRDTLAEVRRLTATHGEGSSSVNELLAGWRELEAGAGADVEPRLVERQGVYLVTGHDDRGEHPLSVLAPRLRAAVDKDKGLLSERERRLFEEHLLGNLGHALRDRRREADDLVRAMNQLLEGVSTSQGIRVRLQWKLRDDIPADARRAVELLGERLEALLPDERRELRDALHRLIEASRAEAPEDSYTEHLARALDYRQWFAFKIRYLRPEGGGTWHELHRRSPLSQGEQKVVCYLPLFAAAAAHFTSLAGASPHSPRIIMLDDAFPKIDARTHPLLFGLLVDLDLDFVITSERLWGDHETVPSLAIYEALRDPAQRGIAQFHHRWDGRRLQAVGT